MRVGNDLHTQVHIRNGVGVDFLLVEGGQQAEGKGSNTGQAPAFGGLFSRLTFNKSTNESAAKVTSALTSWDSKIEHEKEP